MSIKPFPNCPILYHSITTFLFRPTTRSERERETTQIIELLNYPHRQQRPHHLFDHTKLIGEHSYVQSDFVIVKQEMRSTRRKKSKTLIKVQSGELEKT